MLRQKKKQPSSEVISAFPLLPLASSFSDRRLLVCRCFSFVCFSLLLQLLPHRLVVPLPLFIRCRSSA